MRCKIFGHKPTPNWGRYAPLAVYFTTNCKHCGTELYAIETEEGKLFNIPTPKDKQVFLSQPRTMNTRYGSLNDL